MALHDRAEYPSILVGDSFATCTIEPARRAHPLSAHSPAFVILSSRHELGVLFEACCL